jgi:hypothetical protein
MARSPVPADTDSAVFALLVDRWRTMTTVERMQQTDQLCRDIESIAVAGITSLHPEYDQRAVVRELARRRYGEQLAAATYPNAASH